MKKIYFLLVLLIGTGTTFCQSTAIYSVTFDSEWTQANHPHPSGNLPGNAHWSKLVGAVHNDQVTFLAMGELASPGVENIAESGSNGVFFSEVNAEITNGNALSIIDGPDLGTSAGTIEIAQVEVNEDYSYITLATMIAPSPDWIVAVSNLNMLDTNNDWENQVSFDVYPYDAGTDSGVDYTSPNMDTNPQDPISSLQGVAPFSSNRIGVITLQLEEVLNTTDNNLAESISLFPNPARDIINIQTNESVQKIEIFNVLGKQVLQIGNISKNTLEIDLQDLTAGIYMMRVTTENNKSQMRKIIKI